MVNDIKGLFDDIEFGLDDIDIEALNIRARAEQRVKTVDDISSKVGNKSSRKKKLIEESDEIVRKHKEELEFKKAEENKLEELRKIEISKNTIYINVQNSDDRMKVADFMAQGRLILTDKNKPFILAVQNNPIYDALRPSVHTIFCDELIHVTIRKYYLDLELMPVGGRTLTKEVIWAYHKGYRALSMITGEQLEYLLSNNFITEDNIFYSYSDINEGTNYFLGNNSKEPSNTTIEKMKAENMKNYKIKTGKAPVLEDLKVCHEDDAEVEESSKNELNIFEGIDLEGSMDECLD